MQLTKSEEDACGVGQMPKKLLAKLRAKAEKQVIKLEKHYELLPLLLIKLLVVRSLLKHPTLVAQLWLKLW